jgi:hypothetical protein
LWHRTIPFHHRWEGSEYSIFDFFLVIIVATEDEDIVNTSKYGSISGEFHGGKSEGNVKNVVIEIEVRSLRCENNFLEVLAQPFLDGEEGFPWRPLIKWAKDIDGDLKVVLVGGSSFNDPTN